MPLIERKTLDRVKSEDIFFLDAGNLIKAGQKAGNILADLTADIGSGITKAQCKCMLQSPWVREIPVQKP